MLKKVCVLPCAAPQSFSGSFRDTAGLRGCFSAPETMQVLYSGRQMSAIQRSPGGCTEQGWALGQSRAARRASILHLLHSPTPAGTQPWGYQWEKCRKCHSSLGNFILTVPINGKILNQSHFHREPKSSGCFFISLSLIKPNCLLKVVLVPCASRQGMMQQAGNETGEHMISKLSLHLPRGLGKLPGPCFARWSPGDTVPSCQEIFATTHHVPPLQLSHIRARSRCIPSLEHQALADVSCRQCVVRNELPLSSLGALQC